MNNTNKVNDRVMFTIFLIFTILISYFVAGCVEPGFTIFDIYDIFMQHIKEPLRDYRNEYTVRGIIIGLIVFGFAWAVHIVGRRNYMSGREFGSMKYTSPKTLNRKIKDKDDRRTSPHVVPVYVDRNIPFKKLLEKHIYIPPKTIYINTNNRRLSENVSMSMNTRQHGLNDNVLITGGSGTGKTFYEAKPNILNMTGSFIITDPKGEILRDTGSFLEKMGYTIKVFNVLDSSGMQKSTRYNPFIYLRSETDVLKLVTNIFENTDDKEAQKGDPFWDNAGKMLLKALIYYVWLEMPEEKMNFGSVLDLLAKADFKVNRMGVKEDSELDRVFGRLEKSEEEKIEEARERGEERLMHPAVSAYNSVMKGAADTVRSIIITLDAKLDNFKTKEMRELLSSDEMNIPEIGCGTNMDEHTKTALFCVIPDNDATFNFLIGMLYTQIFQQLYYYADFINGGMLPIHVTFLLDEFANVSLPDDYLRLLSTMRSREISCIIIIQNRAQIKELFEKGWQSIPGNCDTQIFLGSGEEETGESISKQLGKATIDKKTSGETLGRQGSSSRNYDRLGRELMLPEEVRLMDNKKCLVFVRGQYPVLDDKTKTFRHPLFKMLGSGKNPYVFDAGKTRKVESESYTRGIFVSSNTVDYAVKNAMRTGKKADIFLCSASEIINLDTGRDYKTPYDMFDEIKLKRNTCKREEMLERSRQEKEMSEKENEVKDSLKKINNPEIIKNFMKLKSDGFSIPQLNILSTLLAAGEGYSDIKELFRPDMSVSEMKSSVEFLMSIKE